MLARTAELFLVTVVKIDKICYSKKIARFIAWQWINVMLGRNFIQKFVHISVSISSLFFSLQCFASVIYLYNTINLRYWIR